MAKIGFDNDRYIALQSQNIRDRIDMFGGKLYMEFGGKLFDDFHASRVLPGFRPDSKVKMLLELKDEAEIVIVINADAIEKIDIITEGIMTVTPDGGFTEEPSYTVAVTYDETELTGMAGARSTVTYRTADRGVVSMIRSGLVSTAMTFKAHHRAICTYETPYMPFSIGIHALTVDNRLDTEGILKLDYIIEIKGARAERCEMTMKVQEDSNF